MKVKLMGGIKDVPLKEVTAANYIVPQREERFWHVLQEKVEYDKNTGKKLSRPVLQKYDTKVFPNTEKYLKDAGYTITILHDPVEYAKRIAAAKAEKQRQIAKVKAAKAKADAEAAKAEAEKKAAKEREALKKQIRDEVLAELNAKDTGKRGGRKGGKKDAEEAPENEAGADAGEKE